MDRPEARAGMRIGLLGGSFDPPHEGHMLITRQALRAFRLDRVWWLASPGNPLKAHGPAAMARRLAACNAIIDHPKVEVTDIETHLGTRYTAQTLAALRSLYPGVRFVWLMGADNLAEFHLWADWRWIMRNFPVGVMARPGHSARALVSPAAIAFRRHRLDHLKAGSLARTRAPAWALLRGVNSPASSTAIREQGEW